MSKKDGKAREGLAVLFIAKTTCPLMIQRMIEAMEKFVAEKQKQDPRVIKCDQIRGVGLILINE